MTTYDNLNIATVSLTFQGEADPSISTRTFDLSTIDFLPNVPLIDQIEVERIFDTGFETKFGGNIFTIADRRQMFILPKAWYSINEQTKILTVVDLSTIPTWTSQNNLYYPNSRTFILETLDQNNAIQTIDIPNFLVNNVAINTPYIRQPDIVIIRRKTLSIDSIVTFAPGTRLTTTQLNLQFNQLKYIVQELISKLRNESILKYDENAIDGPFLGGSDLRMSNNYIKDMNSVPIHKRYESYSSPQDGNVNYTGATFAANVGVVHDALIQGTICRTTMQDAYSGEFTATPSGGSPLRITGMAAGIADSDAATFGQLKNASNLTTGTLNTALILNNAIPLNKLATTNPNNYTLPSNALETVNANTGTFGTNSPNNTGNLLQLTTDNKGRITNISQRNLGNDDLPNVGTISANTYGDSNTPLVQVTVNSKGIITGISERAIASTDLVSINASNISSGTIGDTYLPTSGVTAGIYGNTSTIIPTQLIVDNKGRITSASSGSITTGAVSDFTNQTTSLIQSNAPYWDSTNSVFTALRSATRTKLRGIDAPTANSDAVPLDYLTSNALVVSGGVISAASAPITNMTMRAAGSVTANDAVNYGFIENLVLTPGTTLIGSTTPQIYRDAWSSLTKTSGHLTGFDRYQRTFTDLGAVASTMVLLEADSVTKTFVPYSVAAVGGGSPTVHDGYFWLDTSGANKVLNIWLTTGSTPSGNLVTRNFGLSRLVSGALATTSSTGLVSILAGNDGGINVSAGEISLKTATGSQIGGIKLGTGLVDIGSSVVKVDLSDSISINDSTKAASSKAVKDLNDLVVAKAGSTMTGKLVLPASTASVASLRLTNGADTTSSLLSGDLWFNGTNLKIYNGSITKTLAFTDSNITGSAASWTASRTLTLGSHLSGNVAFNGSADMTLNATLNPASVVISISGTANQITATKNSGTGNVALTLPQDINTTSNVAFNQATVNGVVVGSAANTISTSAANADLVLDPNGTGKTTITGNADVTGNLAVTGTTTFIGAVTLGASSNLTLSNSASRITLAGSGTTIDNASTAVSGISNVGDIYLRTPTNGKVFIIPNSTLSTAPIANNEVIVKSALDTALGSYATTASLSSYMAQNGSLASGNNNQTLGTPASSSGSFIVATDNTNRLTINSSGAAVFTGALTCNEACTLSNAVNKTVLFADGITASNKAIVLPSNYTAFTNRYSPNLTTRRTLVTKEYVDGQPACELVPIYINHNVAGALVENIFGLSNSNNNSDPNEYIKQGESVLLTIQVNCTASSGGSAFASSVNLVIPDGHTYYLHPYATHTNNSSIETEIITGNLTGFQAAGGTNHVIKNTATTLTAGIALAVKGNAAQTNKIQLLKYNWTSVIAGTEGNVLGRFLITRIY